MGVSFACEYLLNCEQNGNFEFSVEFRCSSNQQMKHYSQFNITESYYKDIRINCYYKDPFYPYIIFITRCPIIVNLMICLPLLRGYPCIISLCGAEAAQRGVRGQRESRGSGSSDHWVTPYTWISL